MRLFVSNLNYEVTEGDLQDLVLDYGEPTFLTIVTDKETKQSRGFGFVELPTREALAFRDAQDGAKFRGRTLHVVEAHPPKERIPRDQANRKEKQRKEA